MKIQTYSDTCTTYIFIPLLGPDTIVIYNEKA